MNNSEVTHPGHSYISSDAPSQATTSGKRFGAAKEPAQILGSVRKVLFGKCVSSSN